MGIPVGIYDGGSLFLHEHDAEDFCQGRMEAVSAPREATGRRRSSLDAGPDWRLELVSSTRDAELVGMLSQKRIDGQFGCFWLPNGTQVRVAGEYGASYCAGEISLRSSEEILAMDVFDSSTVAFGTTVGRHGYCDLETGCESYMSNALSHPITHIWYRDTGDEGVIVAFSVHDLSLSVTQLPHTSNHISSLSHELPTINPITYADLNFCATKLAFTDTKIVWINDISSHSQHFVPGLFLQEDELIVSLRFAATKDLLLIATNQRLLVYEQGTAFAVSVCAIRIGAFFDYFDNDTNILVEQQHLYGTHIVCFAFDNSTSQWAPIGYSDVRAQYGVHKVHKFFVLRSQIHVIADSGDYYQFSVTEAT